MTNFYLPEKRLGASFQVVVSRAADADRVEAILLEEVRRGVNEIDGLLADPAPGITFDPGFCDSGLGFTVNYQVAEFAAQFGARAELRKRVLRRLRAEGIELAMPARAVFLSDYRPAG